MSKSMALRATALLVITSTPALSTSTTKSQDILAIANGQLSLAQSQAESDAKQVVQLYGNDSAIAAQSQMYYGQAKAQYDAVIVQLESYIVDRTRKPEIPDLTQAQTKLNNYAEYAEGKIVLWITAHSIQGQSSLTLSDIAKAGVFSDAPASKSRLETAMADIEMPNATKGSGVGNAAKAVGTAAGATSQISPITAIGTVAINAVSMLIDKKTALTQQQRTDEKSLLESIRWPVWADVVTTAKAAQVTAPSTTPGPATKRAPNIPTKPQP